MPKVRPAPADADAWREPACPEPVEAVEGVEGASPWYNAPHNKESPGSERSRNAVEMPWVRRLAVARTIHSQASWNSIRSGPRVGIRAARRACLLTTLYTSTPVPKHIGFLVQSVPSAGSPITLILYFDA